jgi:hypothetical protein
VIGDRSRCFSVSGVGMSQNGRDLGGKGCRGRDDEVLPQLSRSEGTRVKNRSIAQTGSVNLHQGVQGASLMVAGGQ